MTQEPGGQDQESAGVQLSRLLRRWWEEAGSPTGGTRPTQQALAARLGVDQTTLSRYLNPKHLSTAPLRVVEALHAQLRAPAMELERARSLCQAALRENARPRVADSGEAHTTPTDSTGGSAATAEPDLAPGKHGAATVHGPVGAYGSPGQGAAGLRRSRWLRSGLVAAAVVVTFTAGAVFHERLSARDGVATADGAAGAASVGEARYEWPLLYMSKADQFTRARALQNLLNAHGYKVRADGFFTEDTRDAVMDFQKREELPTDGKVGNLTWPALVKGQVGPGSNAFAVRAVQELLNNVGQGGTPVTGRFTAATAEDVSYFQRTHGLRETGRVEESTWLALLVKQARPVDTPAYQRTTSPPSSASG
ncbi:peptidoglycan-binding protein [Streptomyces sp. SID8377]|nr:peptidoglycan-binding protein [Streptomyces sp. SID8377]MYX32679.1 peptidoglycan-binding protein [Streptomyces sp. SID8377]